MNRTTKISLAVTASAGLFVAGTASGAVGAKLVTGDDIAKHTIVSGNLAPQSVGKGKLKPSLRDDLANAGTKGAQGPQGPAGATGDSGAKGEKGDPGAGAPEVQGFITDEDQDGSSLIGGHWLVAVPGNDGGGDTETPILTFHLDAGTYLVNVTGEFFGGSSTDADYGVVTIDQDGDNVPGTVWTSDLPGDEDNAAQTEGSQLLTVPAGGADISVLGSVRGDDNAFAGAQATVMTVTTASRPG